MNIIPTEFDLNKFKNSSVIQISFSLNTINVFFESVGFVTINGSFSIFLDQNVFNYREVYPVKNDFNLLKLLEKKVVDVFTNEQRNILTYVFEDNIILKLIGDDMYESYRINVNGNEIII